MTNKQKLEILSRGRHLYLVRRGRWEYVRRIGAAGVVIVVAVTEDDNVLFVQQYRPPVDRHVIEFPAGLAGDLPGAEDESLEEAARRELEEETGYRAASLSRVFTGASSAGLTNEMVAMFLAEGLEKVAPGGGDAGEDITVHEVPYDEVDRFLETADQRGCLVGARVWAGLYFLDRRRRAWNPGGCQPPAT